MKLDKAIELNKESEASLRKHKFPDHADAIQIGIEAITRILYQRLKPTVPHKTLLPSEDTE